MKNNDSKGEGFHLKLVGSYIQFDLGELSREEFWQLVNMICEGEEEEEEDGEE